MHFFESVMSHVLGPSPSSVTYFIDGPLPQEFNSQPKNFISKLNLIELYNLLLALVIKEKPWKFLLAKNKQPCKWTYFANKGISWKWPFTL